MAKSSTTKIVILGAGGDAFVVAEAVRQCSESGQSVSMVGFLDDVLRNIEHEYPVLGSLDDWGKLDPSIQFVPAIQKVRDMPRRAARLEGLGIPRDRWAKILHPRAVVARDVEVGVGTYIAACATVQPGCRIGDFATLRAGAALGHDVTVEPHGYVGPNATMCGRTVLREGAHLGPNSVVLDQMIVGCYSVVGIGTAITKNVPDYSVMMGNPARRIGEVKPYLAMRSVKSNSKLEEKNHD